MRLEKGYRVWGSDITPETTPDEAGLGFVRPHRQGLPRPRRAAGRAGAAGPGAGCAASSWTTRRTGLPRQRTGPRRRRGRCGRVTSGGFGYRVGASIAYAYLPSTSGVGTAVEVSVFDRWVPAVVRAEPLYDPKMLRVRA